MDINLNIEEQTVYIMRGLPASGKSSLSKSILENYPGKIKRINNDELRTMLDADQYTDDNEKFIKIITSKLIEETLLNGYSVIVDNLNLASRNIARINSIVRRLNKKHSNSIKVEIINIDKNVDKCIEDNNDRTTLVQDSLIRSLYNMFFNFKCVNELDGFTIGNTYNISYHIKEDGIDYAMIENDNGGYIKFIELKDVHFSEFYSKDPSNYNLIDKFFMSVYSSTSQSK